MAKTRVRCGMCGTIMDVAGRLIGQLGRCPKCRETMLYMPVADQSVPGESGPGQEPPKAAVAQAAKVPQFRSLKIQLPTAVVFSGLLVMTSLAAGFAAGRAYAFREMPTPSREAKHTLDDVLREFDESSQAEMVRHYRERNGEPNVNTVWPTQVGSEIGKPDIEAKPR